MFHYRCHNCLQVQELLEQPAIIDHDFIYAFAVFRDTGLIRLILQLFRYGDYIAFEASNE